MRLHLFYFVLCFILLSCQSDKYHWKNQDDRMVLMSGKTVVGELNPSVTKGMNRTDQIEMLDSCTFKITCQYTALEDMETARINLDFVHKSASDYWMIPSVSYNGNNWGRGKEPKGAQQNGKWRTYSYRSTPIPGATYSEGTRFAVAMWSDVPQNEKESISCSLMPDRETTTHRLIWPEEEMPVMYAARDRYKPGYQKQEKLSKGETVTLTAYLSVCDVLPHHYAMHNFLHEAWERADKQGTAIYPPAKIWELGLRYAKEYLWTKEGAFCGFTIGFSPDKSGEWSKRKGYEIGWCGQNASFANSLLFDYIKHNNKESLDKGVATLDAWAKLCRLPNGLFITNYDRISGQRSQIDNVVIDACNLGTAALNYFEATELVKACGLERPDYESLAFGICDFVRNDQQDNGVYGRGWYPNGECFYREGTIGCFMVPPMLEAFSRSKDSTYLSSATRAYDHYVSELKTKGYSTAGALDTWCIDKESSISLLRSALKLYNLTSNKEYLDDAVAVSYYLSTWLWHYNGVYPENDNFTQYNYKTFGATSVSVQHHHLDPYALFWVPEWFELTKLTGDSQWKEKAIAIWNNGCQLISDGTLVINGRVRPVGSQNEAYLQSHWNWDAAPHFDRINSWLVAWPGAFRLETLRKLDAIDAPQIQ